MKLLLFLSLVAILSSVQAQQSYDEFWSEIKAPKITPEHLETIIGGNNHIIVNYYAPWCIYSRDLAQTLDEFYDIFNSDSTRDDVQIVRINCQEEYEFCTKQENVIGYPTIKYYPKEKFQSKFVDISPRTYDNYLDWAENEIGTIYKEVNTINTQEAEEYQLQLL